MLTLRLEDALERIIDYRGKSPPKSLTGTPVISAKVVKSGRILRPIEQTIEPSYYKEWMRRGIPQVGDVVLTTEGPLGEVAQLDEETANFAIGQRVVVLRGKNKVLDNTFLKFKLLSFEQRRIIASFATGTTVEGISQKALRSVPIDLPAYPEQLAISRLLSALEDKIDLNRRMNETLEEMARALFKDWFVDFGPVRAKLEGRDTPSLAPEIAALYPVQFGEDGLPDGWRSGPLSSIIRHTTAGMSPEATPSKLFLHYSIPAFDSGQQPIKEFGLAIKSNKTVVPEGAILMSKLNPTTPRVWLVGNEVGERICSTEFLVYTPVRSVLRSFAYCQLLEGRFRQRLEGMVSGTSNSHQRVSPGAVMGLEIVLPPEGLALAFHEIAGALLGHVETNRTESQTLAALRDLLLPKLMSGELRVRDAEKLVEQAA